LQIVLEGDAMEFCNCGGILEPQKKAKNFVLVCRRCGKEHRRKISGYKLTSKVEDEGSAVVVVSAKEEQAALPKVKILCPKCEHTEAYWWSQQTRAADEPQTRFFRCVKCSHTWREYE
jgi:transcription factor S